MRLTAAERREDQVFRALADPTRRAMIRMLGKGEACVSDLVSATDVTQSAVSQHLKMLRDAGLVKERQEGRRRIYALQPKTLIVVRDWLAHYEEFWAGALDRFGELLRTRHGKAN